MSDQHRFDFTSYKRHIASGTKNFDKKVFSFQRLEVLFNRASLNLFDLHTRQEAGKS